MSGEPVTHRQPRNDKQAAELLERYAVLEREIGRIQNVRNAAIAVANVAADAQLEPLVTERTDIVAKLEPWWAKAKAKLLTGTRKSIELAGCIIGSRKGRDSLDVAGDEATIIAALQKRAWAKELLRTTPSLDRAMVLKATSGDYKAQLAKLGLKRKDGAETFYVERAEQAGTIAA